MFLTLSCVQKIYLFCANFLSRNASTTNRYRLLLQMLCIVWSVCLSVCFCIFDTAVHCAKMAEPVEMVCGMWTCVHPGNYVLYRHHLANTVEQSCLMVMRAVATVTAETCLNCCIVTLSDSVKQGTTVSRDEAFPALCGVLTVLL